MISTNKSKLKKIVLFFSLFLFIFIPKTVDIAHTMTTDETPWMMRSANFYKAIVDKDFASTNQDSNIGIFLKWINTVSYYRFVPNIANHEELYTDDYSKIERIIEDSGGDPLSILAFSRLLMVLILSIAITFIALLLSLLIDLLPAMFTAIMLGYGIFYSGLMRTAHLDAPMATFMTFSVVSFLVYQYAGKKKFFLILSGLVGGASLLAKLFGVMTIAVIGLIGIISFFYKIHENHNKSTIKKLLHLLIDLLIWGLCFMLVVFVFWPAMWVRPIETISDVIQTLNPISNPTLQVIKYPIETTSEIYNPSGLSRYITSYLWYTSSIIILGLFFSLVSFIFKIGLFVQKKIRYIAVSLFISVLGLLISITMISKSAYDYIIPIQLLGNILSSIGWYSIATWFGFNIGKKEHYSKLIKISTITLVAFLQIIYNLSYAPVYLSYLNPLMGGPRKASSIRMIGMGEGLDEAARYLNSKPDAENSIVTSWYGIGPFSFYFKGTTNMIPVWPTLTDSTVKNITNSDYLVTYSNQWYRRYPEQLFLILDSFQPEHQVWIDGIHYANIYSLSEEFKAQLLDLLLQQMK